jgi:hypothetical protein
MSLDEDANFCFQVDFPTLLVPLEEILDVDPNSKWSALLCFLHHNVKDFKQHGAVQIQDDRQTESLLRVIMRNKHKSLVHLYCYRCIDDKEQENNDEENVAKINIICTSEETASFC